jgi:solute carrier family 25 (mitochondrial S-adenosylmethionine transporter), member 26
MDCFVHFGLTQTMKPILLNWQRRWGMEDYEMLSHMAAASMGEAMACTVRVPTEVVKAKMQTGSSGAGATLLETVRLVLSETHGGSLLSRFTGGLYRGYGITLMREIPFAMIQFPLYERFKVQWSTAQGYPVSPIQAAACGSLSGGIAAAVTTPLDVVKTRLMLGVDQHGVVYQSAMDVVQRTYAQGGNKIFFSGIQPRVFWITLGGFVFFGAYEGFKGVVSPVLG